MGTQASSSNPASTGPLAGMASDVTPGGAARVAPRGLGVFLLSLAGLLGAAWAFPQPTSDWALWIVVGVAAGWAAGRGALVWLLWLAVAAFSLLADALGIAPPGPYPVIWAVATAALASVGFAFGTSIGWRRDPRMAAGRAWRGLRARWRRLAMAVAIVALLGAAGFTGYVGVVGSSEVVNASHPSTACGTPGTQFGWDFEAINYDPADDARLAADDPDLLHCRSQGTPAGRAVVSSDGVPIDGWYIPAASGIGPTGPTVLIVHGGKANKSDVLKYAPPFHPTYNLVLLDLRNSGRSGAALTTWGLREQWDLRAMIDWLVRTKHPAWIGVMGNSNGGATAVLEAGTDPRVRALVLDSLHASVVAQLGNVLETENSLPAWPGSWAIVVGASLRIGADITSLDPVRTIGRLGTRPVLLIHGSADRVDRPAESAERNLAAALAAGVPVGLEICPGAGHGTVIDTCPTDWARWALSFMDAARSN